MKRTYFKEHERYKLEAYLDAGLPVKKIAVLLNRHISTIYREKKLGTVTLLNSDLTEYKKYCADVGQRIQEERSHNKGADLKLGNDLSFIQYLENYILNEHYSPYACLCKLLSNNIPIKTKVCLKTIYNYVHSGLLLNVTANHLPMPRKTKKAVNTVRSARNHTLFTSITERPTDINKREVSGHWELDTVESGKGDNTCLFVFTSRKYRQELIYKAPSKTQKSLEKILNLMERKLGAPRFRTLFKTITCDNGVEFLDHEMIERSCINKKLKRTKVYFCHPYNAWERGTNENFNKMIRRWLPKGCSISSYDDAYVRKVQNWMNDYPRKLFGGSSSSAALLGSTDATLSSIFQML